MHTSTTPHKKTQHNNELFLEIEPSWIFRGHKTIIQNHQYMTQDQFRIQEFFGVVRSVYMIYCDNLNALTSDIDFNDCQTQ